MNIRRRIKAASNRNTTVIKFSYWMVGAAMVTAVAVAETPSIPTTPAPVRDIMYIQPFQLETGYEYAWRKERPTVTEGYLVVLKVHPEFVFPRQTQEPILFAGDQTVERINIGYESGMVVAVVPGHPDLKETTFWWGEPGLPEQVDAAKIAQEKTAAIAANIKPFAKEKIEAAGAGRAETLHLADREALRSEAGKLIKQFAPDEGELASQLVK